MHAGPLRVVRARRSPPPSPGAGRLDQCPQSASSSAVAGDEVDGDVLDVSTQRRGERSSTSTCSTPSEPQTPQSWRPMGWAARCLGAGAEDGRHVASRGVVQANVAGGVVGGVAMERDRVGVDECGVEAERGAGSSCMELRIQERVEAAVGAKVSRGEIVGKTACILDAQRGTRDTLPGSQSYRLHARACAKHAHMRTLHCSQ